jgi:hypothetical protein
MIADSSAWIEMPRYRLAGRRLRQVLQGGVGLLMPQAVYQEVLQGASSPRDFMRLP